QPAEQTQQGPAPRFTTSGLPRFLEGARYWLHWAGFPESVYSNYNGTDDYKDDFTSRGRWVNYLAGGSRVLPGRKGLNIPVDISFALHTDAGKRSDDSYVGTLGIYYTDGGRSYADGTPRGNSRILTDMIMRQVVGDIRRLYEPQWTRRSMWDKSYAEARTAEVPSTLLELLSHQNFADMRYGLDPSFRFNVSRSIYKAIGRFISERKGREFIVQPLPVSTFMVQRDKKGVFRLSWQPVEDPIEPTAKPTRYIIMERTEGDLGFKKVGETKSTAFDLKVSDSKIHSVYVLAANEGGVSFPSEVLAFKEGSGKPVLVVNGFTRVSGPASFNEGGRAGFLAEEDFGVPYKYDISFSGYQQEFSRNAGESFGRSGSGHVATVAGGNTFDYPAVHGAAIGSSGRGFVSCSLKAVEEGRVRLQDYSVVDLILGKQKLTDIGGPSGKQRHLYGAFPEALQERLAQYVEKGGHLVVSGQNVATELYSERAPRGSADFAVRTLGLADSSASRSHSGKLKAMEGRLRGESLAYSNTLRKDRYIVESADILVPAEGVKAETLLTFSDTGEAAALRMDRGKGSVVVMSVPFETLLDAGQAAQLMRDLLEP
ncbi:MAG: xanthan lyase, partial [Muribaculaceae bacterium]|nr:xanthan lyase [Muribaculaceae bacterium]